MAPEGPVQSRPQSTPHQVGGEALVAPSAAFGRVVALAGLEDTLAAVRTAALLARTLGTTLRLGVPGMDSLEIHFGQARCDALLAGLANSLRKRLTRMGLHSVATFSVEIDFSDLPAVSIQIHNGDATQR